MECEIVHRWFLVEKQLENVPGRADKRLPGESKLVASVWLECPGASMASNERVHGSLFCGRISCLVVSLSSLAREIP